MTTYVMEAKENYDAARAAQADALSFTVATAVDSHLLGYSFDAARRELVYSALICKPVDGGDNATNDTGHDLWDGLTPIVAGASYPGADRFNFFLARKNIDTGVVTFYDAYDPAAVVPAGIYGGGTARRYVFDTNLTHGQYPALTDPRTSDAWVHQQSCELYVFRHSDNWTLHISPLRPVGDVTNNVEPIGMNATWLYAMEYGDISSTTRNLYLVPRLTTAAETAADVLLAYATYTLPVAFDGSSNALTEIRYATDADGDLFALVCNRTGDSGFKLHKFTQPSAFVYPTPPVDGGFTEKTPWASTTGPNAAAVGRVLANHYGYGRMGLFFSPGRTQLNLLTSVYIRESDDQDTGGSITHTWYNLATEDWASTIIAQGYMTSAFVHTADSAAAAYVVTGAFAATNSYLDADNFYDDGDYAARWIFVEVLKVTAGVVDSSDSRYILVRLTWNTGLAPTLTPLDEAGWDTTYAAYGTAISNPRVVWASNEDGANPLEGYVGFDAGLYDPTANAFWWSGMNAAGGDTTNMFHLDAAFTARTATTGPITTVAQPPILKLSFSPSIPPSPPPSHGRRASVWSNIGDPQLKKNRRPTPTPPTPSAPTVTLSLPNLTGSVNSASPASASAGPVVATAHGGQAPITWGWQVNSGTFGLSSSGDHASVSQVLAAGGLSAGAIRATATDGLGHTGSADINVYLANTYTPTPPIPPVTPPLMAPSVAWTGTAGSGGTAPTDPPRTTAKPALQTYTPSRQRLTANEVYVFDADALGGVPSIEVWLEGTTQTVLRSVYTDTDVNGNARQRDGYAVTVDVVSAAARHSTGAAMNMYATATASDATMQKRVIGPIVIFPRNTPIVWSKTIKPSGGGDFTSLAAAKTQFLIDQPESAEITYLENATIDLPIYTSLFTGHTGYVVFKAAPGVTVTLTRGLVFTPDPAGSLSDFDYAWNWMPFCGPIEFRGSGIVLDFKFWSFLLVLGSNPHWFNGCTITNSAGRDQLAWNKQAQPGMKLVSGSFDSIASYFTDVTVSYVSGIAGAIISGMKAHDAWGNHDQCHFISGGYETNIDPRFFSTPIDALSVSYSGGGVGTIVTDSNARSLDCKVNGVSVGGAFPLHFNTDQCGQRPSDTYYQMSAIAAAISGVANWSATVLDSTRAGISILGSGGNFTIGTGTHLVCFFDIHSEWSHLIGGVGVHIENIIVRDNIVRRSYFNTAPYNSEALGRDMIVKGNVWECATQSGANGGFRGEHVVVTNNYYDSPLVVGDAVYWDSYGLVAQNAANGLLQSGGWSSLPPTQNNATVGALPTGAGNTGNFAVADLAAACVTSKTTGDFRPGGTLLTNVKPRVDLSDGRNNARAVSDAVGPWAVGYGPPSYPF